jgi:hypothetical protein
MKRIFVCLTVVCAMACGEKAEPPASRRVAMERGATAPAADQGDSARAFVQRFYDWYLATEARKGSPYDSLLAGRRVLLGDSLASAFRADMAVQLADTIAEIVSLSAEEDVFLNSQDPCPRYVAGRPRPTGAATFAVLVAGSCAGLDARPNIEVHVSSSTAGWRIENIRDPTNRSFDLLSALLRYHADAAKPAEATTTGRP